MSLATLNHQRTHSCQPPAFLSTSVNLCQPQTGCNPFATGRFVNLTTYFIKFVMYKPCEITNSIVFFRITCTVQTIFAIDNLHKKINLYNYDLVVMPESSSNTFLLVKHEFGELLRKDSQIPWIPQYSQSIGRQVLRILKRFLRF